MTHLQTRPERVAEAARPPRVSRLQQVLDAHRTINSDLSFRGTLDRVAAAAVALTGADTADVSVVGVSGEVVRHTAPNRPAAGSGVGGGEPGRRLEATIAVRGARFAEVAVGTASEFADDAGRLLDALAELAGTALENALLYEDSHRSKDWLLASGEIARSLLSDAEGDMLMEVVLRALHVAEADSVGLFLPVGAGRVQVAVATGRRAAEFRNTVIDADGSDLGRAILRGESLLVDDIGDVMCPGYPNERHYGPVMAAPLVDARGVRGSVVLCRNRGRRAFTARDLDLATTFADQLALALEMDDARLRGEWVKVLEDRHRIAQDLHDNVMQRLFATGVGLQSLAAAPLPPEIARRLGRYIADLDETIDEIRTRVFGLRDADGSQVQGVRTRFPRVAAQAAEATQAAAAADKIVPSR